MTKEQEKIKEALLLCATSYDEDYAGIQQDKHFGSYATDKYILAKAPFLPIPEGDECLGDHPIPSRTACASIFQKIKPFKESVPLFIKEINLPEPRFETCDTCHGKGVGAFPFDEFTTLETCYECDGSGKVLQMLPLQLLEFEEGKCVDLSYIEVIFNMARILEIDQVHFIGTTNTRQICAFKVGCIDVVLITVAAPEYGKIIFSLNQLLQNSQQFKKKKHGRFTKRTDKKRNRSHLQES